MMDGVPTEPAKVRALLKGHYGRPEAASITPHQRVETYQISNLVTSLGGGWHLLTAAAFLSMALPMLVFFDLQRYFVRGLLAGAVKG